MDILLVDDNVDYLMLMKDLLYSNGYSVTTATDGTEACELLDTNDIDLIISDIKIKNKWVYRLRDGRFFNFITSRNIITTR